MVAAVALVLPFLLCAALAAAGRPLADASAVVGLALVIVAASATGLRSAGPAVLLADQLSALLDPGLQEHRPPPRVP